MLARRLEAASPPDKRAGREFWARRLDAGYPDREPGRDVAYRVDRLPLGLALMYAAPACFPRFSASAAAS